MIQAFVLLAVVLDLPILGRIARRVTPEPKVIQFEVEGVPVEMLRPPDDEPRPAWIFVNGAHPLRRREPVVWRLAQGLARAGYVVFVPDIPGLGEGTVTTRTLEAAGAVTAAACRRRDVRAGRVALVGASTGAGLALIAAGRPDLAERVSVVAAVAPFADLRKLICLTTTGYYEENGGFAPYEVTDLHRQVVARSLVAAIATQPDRDRLLAALDEIERAELDPLDELPRRADDGLSREAQVVLDVLANRDPERFGDLFEALPPAVHEFIEELSPLRFREGLQARIEICVPPSDVYFPPGEAAALAALPNARLTVTRTLDHTRPSLSLVHVRSFIHFLGFVARGLRAAR